MQKNVKKRLTGFLIMMGMTFLVSGSVKAEEIIPAQANTEIEGSTGKEKESNRYRFIVDETGYQNLRFFVDETDSEKIGMGWTIRILDEENRELFKKDWVKESFELGKFVLKKGSAIRLEVRNNTLSIPNGAKYRINFQTVKSDDFEVEENGSFGKGNVLENGKGKNGNLLSAKDEDFFIYKIPENGVSKIDFKIGDFSGNQLGDGFGVEIYDKNKKLLKRYTSVKADFRLPTLTYKRGTRVYLRVYAPFPPLGYPQMVDYSIKAVTKASNAWERENNDSFRRATELDGKKYGLLLTKEDVDYYAVTSRETAKYKLRFNSGDNVAGTYEIKVFSGKKKKPIITKYTKGNESIGIKLKKGEKIYIGISSVPFSYPGEQPYSLKIIKK